MADIIKDLVQNKDSFKSKLPISEHIDIPPNLELLNQPSDSEHGTTYLDRANKRVYRKMELGRNSSGNEDNEKADFQRKIDVSINNITGLTPRIYRYDPENFIIEMEYIEGTRLDKVAKNDLPIQSAQNFWIELNEWHKNNLYHGDLFSGKNYILESTGRIRLIDPTIDHSEIEDAQDRDRGRVIDLFERHFGITKANLTGKLVSPKIIREGKTLHFELPNNIPLDQISYVYQRGIGFTGLDEYGNNKRYLETSDFDSEHPSLGPCVVVVCRNPLTKQTAILHADSLTDLDQAQDLISKQIDDGLKEVSIVGGESDQSEPIINKINEKFSKIRGVKLINQDTLGEKGRVARQVICDNETGDIYVLYKEARRYLKSDDEKYRINNSKRRSVINGSPNLSLTIDCK